MGNVVTTVNLLTTATELGVDRIVLVGSLEEPGRGELATVPSSPYAASKWAAGDYARMFHALFGTPVVIARTFMVYGPGQVDGRKLVPYVTRALLRGVAPELSSATRPVDWIYVDDVVDGLLALGVTPGAGGESFDVGSGQLVPVRDVVLQLADIIRPSVEIEFGAVPDRPLEQVRVADATDTKARIGWEAQVALRDGLERCVEWYAEHP
jgi:nucleoside-diphosphate-sugar epimerase